MKIAVTGGTGFIGSWFLRMLPDDVTAIVLTRSATVDRLKYQKRTFPLVETDFSQASLATQLADCDAVLHLAAARPLKTNNSLSSNIINDYNIFQACQSIGISNIVCCSSRGVYGNNPNTPWIETQQPTPNNEYALGKLQSEIAAEYFNRQFNMAIKSLRISQVFGLGELDTLMTTTFLTKAYHKLPLTVSVIGEIRREYIYVKDLVEALFLALKLPEKKGIFNLGSSWYCSIKELAEVINSVAENPHEIIFSDNPSILNENSIMNNEKFYSEFNWRPGFNLIDAVQDIFADLYSTELAGLLPNNSTR